MARSHTAAVLDTDWSPHNDSIVASGGEDGKVMIWKVEDSAFEGWGQEGWVPQDFDPVLRIDGSPRKIGQVLFHPTASNVLASSSGEYTIKLWDLANPEDARSILSGHSDIIQSMAFNPTGTLLATTCRDRKLRLFDPRTGGDAVRITDGHGGIKGSRVAWMGELGRIATTGFSKMSDRQVSVWDTGNLENIKTLSLDQSAGVVIPFWTDNNILFLGTFVSVPCTSFQLSDHGTFQLARGTMPQFLCDLSNIHRTLFFIAMAIFDTTSMSRIRFLHLPSINQQNPSGACVSYPDAPSASRIAKSRVLTKYMGRPLNLSLLSCPEKYVNSHVFKMPLIIN